MVPQWEASDLAPLDPGCPIGEGESDLNSDSTPLAETKNQKKITEGRIKHVDQGEDLK